MSIKSAAQLLAAHVVAQVMGNIEPVIHHVKAAPVKKGAGKERAQKRLQQLQQKNRAHFTKEGISNMLNEKMSRQQLRRLERAKK